MTTNRITDAQYQAAQGKLDARGAVVSRTADLIAALSWTYDAGHDDDPASGPKEPDDGYRRYDYFDALEEEYPSPAATARAIRAAYKGPDCCGVGLDVDGLLLGYLDRDTALEASAHARATPAAYELEDGSWAAAHEGTIDSEGGCQHWALLRDGQLVRVEHGAAPGTWRVPETR